MNFVFKDRIRLSECMPWRWMFGPETIATSSGPGGSLLRCAHVVVRDLESVGPLVTDVYHHQLSNLLFRLGGGWTIWIDQFRWNDPHYLPECDFGGCHAARIMDESRRRQFAEPGAPVFNNSVFLSCQYNADKADWLFEYLSGQEQITSTQAILARFDEACKKLHGELARLVTKVEPLRGPALLSYLSQTCNFDPNPVNGPCDIWIAEHLASATWHTGRRPKIGRRHVRTVEFFTIGDLTSDTFEALHSLPFECRWTVRIETRAKEVQARELQRLIGQFGQKRRSPLANIVQHVTRRQQEDTNMLAVARMEDAKQLRLEIQMADKGYAYVSCNIHTWHEDPDRADAQAEEIERLIKGRGSRAESATLNAYYALLADVPGNGPSDRQLPALTAQITRLCPVTGIVRGSPRDAQWDGPALLMGNSLRGIPVYFSYHAAGEDVGNTMLIGQTGSGKSILLAHMALETMKYPSSKVILFDRHSSFMIACWCAGGDWINLGVGEPAVQPLRNIHDPAQFSIAHDWLCRALRFAGTTVDAEMQGAITDALYLVAARPPDERTVSELINRLGGSQAARNGLRIYARTGQYGALLDGVVDSYGRARIVGIDCEPIMTLDVAPLVISAIFTANKFERMQSGDPFAVFFDEAKALLSHPAFAAEIDYMAREIRKANGVLVMATQSQADFEQSTTTKVIFDQSKNRIYLPDPNVQRQSAAQFLTAAGLEPSQIRDIAHAVQKGDYYVVTPEYQRLLEIRLADEAVAICGKTTTKDKLLARTWIAEGVKPGRDFLHRWLDHASAAESDQLVEAAE